VARGGIGQKLEDRGGGHRFARAGLADECNYLAALYVERDTVDRQALAATLVKGDGEIAHGE
jgi:hypothetical protein